MKIRTYTELSKLKTFDQRYDYLRLEGSVGRATFGFDRYLNQKFYTSREWQQARDRAIARDLGLDLGVEGHEIFSKILVHHMNPINAEQIESGSEDILDPEFLITTTHRTHNAIHYGDKSLVVPMVAERTPNDTTLW